MDHEHRHLLRLRHRVFDSNHPNAWERLANLRCNFDTIIFVVIAWGHGATGDEHVMYALDSKKQGRVAEIDVDFV